MLYRIANFDSFLKKLLIKEKADSARFHENSTTWQELTPEEKVALVSYL